MVAPLGASRPFDNIQIGNRKDWTVECDNSIDEDHDYQKMIDGYSNTHWLGTRNSSSQPSVVTIDLGMTRPVMGISVLPRQDESRDGNIAEHEIYLSIDRVDWATPIAYGTWWVDKTLKRSDYEATLARYIRFVAITDAMRSSFTGIAEFNVYVPPSYNHPDPAGVVGAWGPTINTPIVPVTAFVDPFSHKVIMLSSKRHDAFPQDLPGFTLTAIWDPDTKEITQARVEHTDHNMFCPGLAFDAEGRLIVTGGATAKETTIFDGAAKDPNFHDQWSTGAEMILPRGYQAAVLNADGTMFVLGGSWGDKALMDPQTRKKHGEIYGPKSNTWTSLPLCRVEKA